MEKERGRRELSCVSRRSGLPSRLSRRAQPSAPLEAPTSGAPWIQPTPEIRPPPSISPQRQPKGAQSHLSLFPRRSISGSDSAVNGRILPLPPSPNRRGAAKMAPVVKNPPTAKAGWFLWGLTILSGHLRTKPMKKTLATAPPGPLSHSTFPFPHPKTPGIDSSAQKPTRSSKPNPARDLRFCSCKRTRSHHFKFKDVRLPFARQKEKKKKKSRAGAAAIKEAAKKLSFLSLFSPIPKAEEPTASSGDLPGGSDLPNWKKRLTRFGIRPPLNKYHPCAPSLFPSPLPAPHPLQRSARGSIAAETLPFAVLEACRGEVKRAAAPKSLRGK